MVTQTVAQTLRVHGDFIQAIATAVGSRPFTSGSLAVSGVKVPKGVSMRRFRTAGVFVRVDKDNRFANTWRLSPDVLEHYAAQGASA